MRVKEEKGQHPIEEIAIAIAASESRFRTIFDNANDVIVFVTKLGKILEVNKRIKDILGYDQEELIGKNFLISGILAARNATTIVKLFKKAVDTGGFPHEQDRDTTEVWLNHKDGHVVLVEASTTAIRKSGKIEGFLSILHDVTERRKTEEAYRSLVEHSLQGLIIFQDGRVVFANKAMAEISGYTVQEMLETSPETVQAFVHPDDRELVWRRHELRLKGEILPERYEIRGIRKDGSICWLEIQAVAVEYQGKPAIQAAYVDITQRKKATEALRESEEKHRAIFENAREAIVTFDLNAKITNANKLVEEYGFKREELIGQSLFDFVLEDKRAKAIEDFETLLRGHPLRGEMDLITPKGIITVEYSDNPILYAGKVVGVQAILNDITDRKKSEAAIRESEERLKILFESAPDGIYLCDLKGNFIDGNRMAEELTGYTREELIGRNFTEVDLLWPDDIPKALANLSKTAVGRPAGPDEFTLRRKDGTQVAVEIRTYPVRINNQNLSLGIARDITERKKADRKLRDQKEILQTILDNIPVMIAFVDSNATHKWVNQAWKKNLGWSSAEAQSRDILKELYPDPEYRQHVVEFISKTQCKWGDFKTRRRDGTVLDTTWTNVPLADGSNLGIGLDITERKKAEHLLQKERDKAQKYLDIAAVMMVAVDSEQRVGLINNKGCEVLGYTEEEILGKNWFDNFLPERIRNEVKAVFEKFVTGQKDAPAYFENFILTKAGQERLIAWHNTTLKDDEGGFVAILSSGEDITERKQIENRLRRSEEKYRELFENAREAIFAFDPQGNITDVNKLVESYGFKREQLIGRSLFDFIIEDHKPKAVEDFETLLRGCPVRGEMDVVTPKGTMTVEYSDNPIIHAEKIVGVQAILMDITERKKAEEALKRQTLLSQVFLDSMPCVALLLRPKTRVIVASNRQAEEIGAVPNATCYGTWPRRESPCDWCLAPEVWATGEPRHLVVESEGIVWDAHWIPIEKDLYLHYAFDVTQRTKMEEALRESEEKFRAIFNTATDGILLMEEDTQRFFAGNQSLCRMLGYSQEELEDLSVSDIHLAVDTPYVLEQFSKQTRAEESLSRDIRIKRKNGSIFYADIKTSPIALGGKRYLLSVLRDVTQRRKAQEDMENLAKFPSENPYPIMRISQDGIVLFSNPASAALLSNNRSGIGQPVPPDWRKVVESTLASGSVGRMEVNHAGRVFSFRAVPLTKAGYANFYGTDITERKRAEEKLFEYQAKLRAMASEILRAEDRERRRLAIGLHDNICQGLVLTKLAIESSLPLVSNPKVAASLRIAAEAIGETIEEADSLTFELSSPVLREFGLVPALEKYIHEQVRRKHSITCELESNEEISALSDEIKSCLFRVTRELLMNAVRHARANKIRVCIRESQSQFRLSVYDDGIGFKFDEMSSGASKKSRFGLFSVREQLEYLGGSLEIDSEPGRGTTVTVIVPLKGKTQD